MTGLCEHCGESFEIKIYHSGFGDSSYAYCDSCGMTAILSAYSAGWPKGVKWTYAEIPSEMEEHLLPCECGGKFSRGNSPRCPKCKESLSADNAAGYIEAQSPGTCKGSRWQRNWRGLYCAVINGRSVADNFV